MKAIYRVITERFFVCECNNREEAVKIVKNHNETGKYVQNPYFIETIYIK
jgi:hypothetical protein